MNEPYRVAVLLSENLLATSATLPIEILNTAAGSARANKRDARAIEIHSLSLNGEPVPSSSGFSLTPTASIGDNIGRCDLILIPGFWRNPRPMMSRHRAFLPWLVEQHEQGSIISAVGTGCCYLAEAGLLDGKAATTHWHYFDQFQRDYPQIELTRQYFITRADNLYCAASINALTELMVNIVFRWYGRTVANIVQRNFFHEIRNSFEPTKYYSGETIQHPDEQIVQAQIWMQDNFHKTIQIAALAEQFEMSLRTFNRRFKNALGHSPLSYLQELRLNAVKDLLQHSNLTLTEIASRCGYQDVSFLTQLFKRHFNVPPGRYRDTVRAKLFRATND